MRAAALDQERHFKVVEREIPDISDSELLVKIVSCGICTSELDMWEGKNPSLKLPLFLGHEISGIVEKTGEKVSTVSKGDPVAVFAEGNGYSEFVAVPEKAVYKLKDHKSMKYAIGEPIACAVNGVKKLEPELNDSVCIVGCGFMGLIMLQVFKARGVGSVIAVDTRPNILKIALALGADHVFNPAETDVVRKVMEITNGTGVDIGVEAAGKQATLDLTTKVVRMEGKLEVFGYHQGEPRAVDWGYWNWMAFKIVNGHTRSQDIYIEGMVSGLKMLERGALNMEALVTHEFRLEDINEGFDQSVKKSEDFVKGIITI